MSPSGFALEDRMAGSGGLSSRSFNKEKYVVCLGSQEIAFNGFSSLVT